MSSAKSETYQGGPKPISTIVPDTKSTRIRVSAVSYINSFPFIYGLNNSSVLDRIDLSLDPPAKCAEKLISGEVDVGLVPVATISKVSNAQIFTPFCIGANGAVQSVCLYAECNLNDIETILLDPESRTSVRLAQILAKKHWNINPKWENAEAGFENRIEGTTAGVVIGDRAFKLNSTELKRWDLSEQWHQMTGLPFVFATWVSNCPLPQKFISEFNSALQFGMDNRRDAINNMLSKNLDNDAMIGYVENSIQYCLGTEEQQAMERFQEMMETVEIKQKSG